MKINYQYIKRVLLYLVLLCVIFILQSSFDLNIIGHKINLIPTVFIAISLLDSLPLAVGFAFFSGILTDLNFFLYEGISSAIFMVFAILIYFLAIKFFTNGIFTNMMFVSIAMLFHRVMLFVFYYVLVDPTSFLVYFKVISAEILIATLLAFIPYLLVYQISTTFRSKNGD